MLFISHLLSLQVFWKSLVIYWVCLLEPSYIYMVITLLLYFFLVLLLLLFCLLLHCFVLFFLLFYLLETGSFHVVLAILKLAV